MLNIKDPSPTVLKQKQCMEYILRSVLDGPNTKDKNNFQRLKLLVHGNGGCGKSVVARAAAHMLRQSGRGVVLSAPTGVAAFNINGATLHSSLLLPVVNQSYGKTCDVPLPRGEQLAALQSFWRHVDVLVVDEMGFVSKETLERMDSHLRLARDMSYICFGGLHVIFMGDLYQLPPPGGGNAFMTCHMTHCLDAEPFPIELVYWFVVVLTFQSLFQIATRYKCLNLGACPILHSIFLSSEHCVCDCVGVSGYPIFASKLWLLFELCELEGNQRAAKDPEWAALLARVRVGQWTDADIETLHSLVIKKGSGRTPAPGAVHLFATRKAVADHNHQYIMEHVRTSGAELHDCPAADISVNTGAPLAPEKAWPRSEDTGGLETLLQLAEGVQVMLRKNLDVQDGLVNGARGKVEKIAVFEDGEVDRVWVKFEKGAGDKWAQNNESAYGVAIQRCQATFKDIDGNKAERRQFPLVLAKATTIHKSQAATYHAGVHACLDKTVKQAGQAYVALSRSPTKDLCTLESFHAKSLVFNIHAEWALTSLKAKLASSPGPKNERMRELWEAVIKPKETAEHYKAKLAGMAPPNWKAYAEEQKALAQETNGKKGGTLTCPRCGWTAADEKLLKNHKPKCPAKKTRAKAKAKAKSKPKATPKSQAAAAPKSQPSRPLLGNAVQQSQPPKRNKRKRTEEPAATAHPMPVPKALPPLPPPAESPPEAVPVQFFQRQRAAHCGMHALNNALQGAIFRPMDMKSAAQAYLQEMRGLDEARHEHIRAGGWYSIQVLYTALFAKGFMLDLDNRVLAYEQAVLAEGPFVQNWSNVHWVAYLLGADSNIYLLDSMKPGPEVISEAAFAASLVEHETYAVNG